MSDLKAIDVSGDAKRSFVLEKQGSLTLTVHEVQDASKAYLGSDVGHDAFNVELFKMSGLKLSRGDAGGIEAIFAVMRASLVHAQPWILVSLLFATLFAASKLGSRTLRVLFFWIPAVTISSIAIDPCVIGRVPHDTIQDS